MFAVDTASDPRNSLVVGHNQLSISRRGTLRLKLTWTDWCEPDGSSETNELSEAARTLVSDKPSTCDRDKPRI